MAMSIMKTALHPPIVYSITGAAAHRDELSRSAAIVTHLLVRWRGVLVVVRPAQHSCGPV